MKKKAVVVGAGFAGLSGAALLARAGWEVTLLERHDSVGGRARLWENRGFRFDMGPSWYLMPEVFERYFGLFGKSASDYYTLEALDPGYRVFFEGEGPVDVGSDAASQDRLFASFEKGGDRKLRRYLVDARYKYDTAMKDFLYRDFRGLGDFLSPRVLAEGLRMKVFGNLHSHVRSYFSEHRAQKILEYPMVFLGASPRRAPALYSLMSHVDLDLGVWYPKGGLNAVARGMGKLCEELGVRIELGQKVDSFLFRDGAIAAVSVGPNDFAADAVLFAGDYADADTRLLPRGMRSFPAKYWDSRVLAPSMMLLYLGISRKIQSLAHHNLYFARDWDRHFDAIFTHPAWPENPSFYLGCPSRSDASVAPAGKENVFILAPLACGLDDSDGQRERYADYLLSHVAASIGEDFRADVEVQRIFSARDFRADYDAFGGSALGLSHTLRQSAAFRPPHRSRKVPNLFYTGQFTHPGIGVPMVVISSEISVGLMGSALG